MADRVDYWLRRPPACIRECSSGNHAFGGDGSYNVITTARPYETSDHLTGMEWDEFSTITPKTPTRAAVVGVVFVHTAFEGDVNEDSDSDTFLCRCDQHVLKETKAPKPRKVGSPLRE